MMQFIEQLRNKIRLIVGHAIIRSVNSASSSDGLSVDISLPGGEHHSKVPLIQQYGIASKPNKNAEAVVLFIGGARDNGFAIATQGKTSSIPTLDNGEVALFSEYGQTILLKKDGSIQIKAKSEKSVVIDSKLEVKEDISCSKTITASTDVKAGIVSLSTHIHAITGVTPGTGAGVCGSPTNPPTPDE